MQLGMPDEHGFYPNPEESSANEALNPINVTFYTTTV